MSSLIINALKKASIFSSLKNEDLKEIVPITKNRYFRENGIIFHQEDSSNYLCIIKSGQVKISLLDKSGKEMILKIINENDFFGEMSLLDGFFRSATVTAVEDTKALLISRKDFIDFIHNNPSIALK